MYKIATLLSVSCLMVSLTACSDSNDTSSPVDAACAQIDCGDNGLCSEGQCYCADGFQGDRCQFAPGVDPCESVECGDNGSCEVGECVCTSGFSGPDCSVPPGVDPCEGVECGDNGSCDDGECVCTGGFTGPDCSVPPGVDPCEGVECGDNGSCDDGECVCTGGFTGPDCSVPPEVDPCEGVECGDNGSCDDGECVCTGGFTGPDCSVPPGEDPCEGVECGDNGSCDDGECVCTDGFTGPNCDIPPADLCEDVDCGEQGSCRDGACICRNGFSGVRCDIPPGECDNEICEQQVIFNSPIPKTPVVGYVGGSNYDGTFRFDSEARLGHYDFLIVGFVNFWEQARHTLGDCQAPAEAPLDSAPVFLSNACIQGPPDFLPAPPEWSGCTIMQCGGTGPGSVGAAVLRYQENGGRVLMSIGGANSDATNMDPEKGHALALAIWNMFLGGTDPRYVGFRPFGPQVVLDGVDLDLEQSPVDCPSGPQCLAVQEGWHNFVVTLRELMDADTRKEYLITAVPINTKHADPSLSFPGFGAYTYGYLPGISHCSEHFDPLDDVGRRALETQPALSVYSVLYMIDFLWPQFYPSPTEITLNGDCWDEDFLAWTHMAAQAPEGRESRCRVGVGVPFSQGAANGGQIAADEAFEKIRAELAEHPILRERFGGMFGWDEYWDHTENQGAYSRALKSGLEDPALQALVD